MDEIIRQIYGPPRSVYPVLPPHQLEVRQINFNSVLSQANSIVNSVLSPVTSTQAAAPAAATTAAAAPVQDTSVVAPAPVAATSPTSILLPPGVITSIPIETAFTSTAATTTAVPTLSGANSQSSTTTSTSASASDSAGAGNGNKGSGNSGSSGHSNVLPIALGVSLGTLFLAAIALLLCLGFRRQRRKNAAAREGGLGSDNETILNDDTPRMSEAYGQKGAMGGIRPSAGPMGGNGGAGGGMGAIEALGAGAATGGAIGAAENIARRSRQSLSPGPGRSPDRAFLGREGRNNSPGGSPARGSRPNSTNNAGAFIPLPPPHMLSGQARRSNSGEFGAYGDPFDDINNQRRALHSGPPGAGSSRHSLPLAGITENPDEIVPVGSDGGTTAVSNGNNAMDRGSFGTIGPGASGAPGGLGPGVTIGGGSGHGTGALTAAGAAVAGAAVGAAAMGAASGRPQRNSRQFSDGAGPGNGPGGPGGPVGPGPGPGNQWRTSSGGPIPVALMAGRGGPGPNGRGGRPGPGPVSGPGGPNRRSGYGPPAPNGRGPPPGPRRSGEFNNRYSSEYLPPGPVDNRGRPFRNSSGPLPSYYTSGGAPQLPQMDFPPMNAPESGMFSATPPLNSNPVQYPTQYQQQQHQQQQQQVPSQPSYTAPPPPIATNSVQNRQSLPNIMPSSMGVIKRKPVGSGGPGSPVSPLEDNRSSIGRPGAFDFGFGGGGPVGGPTLVPTPGETPSALSNSMPGAFPNPSPQDLEVETPGAQSGSETPPRFYGDRARVMSSENMGFGGGKLRKEIPRSQ